MTRAVHEILTAVLFNDVTATPCTEAVNSFIIKLVFQINNLTKCWKCRHSNRCCVSWSHLCVGCHSEDELGSQL